MEFNEDKEIELIVSYYSKKGDKELLRSAIQCLIKKVRSYDEKDRKKKGGA